MRFAGLEDVDTLITDSAPEGKLAEALEESNVEVLIA